MKKFFYVIIAVITLSSCEKKVTLKNQSIYLQNLIVSIEHKELQRIYANDYNQLITVDITGYCDKELDKSQISWSDLYGEIEMRNSEGDLILTCTREKFEYDSCQEYGWHLYNPIKIYITDYYQYGDSDIKVNYCACEITGKMCEGEGGMYYLNSGCINAYSLHDYEHDYKGKKTIANTYLSWQQTITETSYDTTAWYPNGQITYRFAGDGGYWVEDESEADGDYMKYKNVVEEYYHKDGTPFNQFEILFWEQQRYNLNYIGFRDEDNYFIMYSSQNDNNSGRVAIVYITEDTETLKGCWQYDILDNNTIHLHDGIEAAKYSILEFKTDFKISVSNYLKDDTMYVVTPIGNWYEFKYIPYGGGVADSTIKWLRSRGRL